MSENDFGKSLIDALTKLNISVEKERFKKFVSHYQSLMQFNRVVNLTALEDPSQIAYKLFADSFLPLEYVRSFPRANILDIGPGGGFPSMPLRILTSDKITFTLVERRKKVVFYLEELISSLSLSNIQVVSGRVEHLTNHEALSKRFDLVLNKAVFKGDIFFPLVSPFLKDRGKALRWGKSEIRDEKPPNGWKVIEIIGPSEYDYRFPGVVVVYEML